MTISLDLETKSGADLKKGGVYVYAADPAFEIQLLAYSIDGGPVHQIDLTTGDKIPGWLATHLLDPNVKKRAYNAMFERICLSRYLVLSGFIDPEGWECTSVRSSASGLPASLDEICKFLGMDEAVAKKDGKRLIRLFAINGADPKDYPEEWEAYKAYNIGDVIAEMAIRDRLDRETPFMDQAVYELDQRINDAGVMLDLPFIDTVTRLEGWRRQALESEVKGLTYLTKPNSPIELIRWLNARLGLNLTSANKETLTAVKTDDPVASKVLACRREMSLSSVKKFAAMRAGACEDGRARGLFRCCGAGRTGRWSSVRIQFQNLAKGDGKFSLDVAKSIVGTGNLWLVESCYAAPMKLLSAMVRPALIASPGNELVIGDFSAIEARVIAWYAQEQWVLDVFNGHGAIYEAAASRMYNVPVDRIIEGYKAGDATATDQRAKGKVATLALGYQGAVGALIAMGADKMGLSELEMKGIVTAWRSANAKIVTLWRDVENMAKACILRGTRIKGPKGLIFAYSHAKDILTITLPSGRSLVYRGVKLEGGYEGTDKFGRPLVDGRLSYMGYSSKTRVWSRQETYGGKLVENIVQATARDCLANAMALVDFAGYTIVMHVHDEIVADMPKGTGTNAMKAIMSVTPEWAPGLPLAAKVEVSEYYTK